MKSLESLEIINICLEELYYKHKEDTNIWRYDLEVIQKDLEILKFIKENFEYGLDWISGTPHLIGHCEIENEDKDKLKQWLKSNNVGDDQ